MQGEEGLVVVFGVMVTDQVVGMAVFVDSEAAYMNSTEGKDRGA